MGRNLCWKKYCQRIQNHQKQVDNSIKNITNWEMSTSLITTSKISTHETNLSVFILGIVIILYLVGIKVLNCNKKRSSKEMHICSHMKCTKSKVSLCLIFNMRLTKNFNEPLYKIRRHQLNSPFRLFLKKTTSQDTPAEKLWMFAFLIMLLIIAGDVEINPGPFDELHRELMKHLRPLASEYDCVDFGIQLHINFDEIKAMKSDRTPLLATLLHHWLCNTQEDKQFSILCKALETIGRNDLVHIIQQNYTAHPFKVKSATATSHSSNPALQHPPQYSENTAQTSRISHNESITATSSKSLEVTETLSSGEIPFSIKLSERFNDEDIIHEDSKYTLHFQALDPDDVKNKAELEKETKNITDHYSKICDDFYKFLEYNPSALDKLKYILEYSYNEPIEKNDRYHNITRDQIEDIEDFHKLWRIFNRFNSFFNFRLLERAFKVTKYEDGMQEIIKYHKVFQEYLRRRVTHCPSGIGMKGDDHVVLLVKLDNTFTKCTMNHLVTLGKDICEIIRAKEEKLHIEGVQTGSFCVLLHLHKSAIPNGFVLNESQIGALKQLRYMEAKILTIECGTVQYIIHNSENELLKELIKHLRPISSECDCVNFGIQLGVDFDDIKAMKSDRMPLIANLLHHWLCNTHEDKQFSILYNALEAIKRNDLVHLIQQNYTEQPFKVKSATATSHSSNPALQHLPQYLDNTTQTSQISHNESTTPTFSKTFETTETISADEIQFKDEDIIHEDIAFNLPKMASPPPSKRRKTSEEKRYKTVLLGETGAGKTSFVELLLNYAKQFGMTFDLEEVSSFAKSEAASSCESDTTFFKKYVAEFCDFKLEIIDTPGFVDTRGSDQYKQNISNIIHKVKQELYVNSVCLIINGTAVCLSDVMKEVIRAVLSILPPDVLNNVIIVYTKTQDKCSLKIDRSILKEFGFSVPKERTFVIDNPYARLQNIKENPEDFDEEDKEMLLENFEKTHKILDKMFEVTRNLKPAGEFHEAIRDIRISLAELQVVFDNKKKVEQLLVEVDLNKKKEIEYIKIIVQTSGKYHVVCTESGCNTNCHKDCDCEYAFTWIGLCSKFMRGVCQVCKHSFWYHRKAEYYYDTEKRVIEVPDVEKKRCLEEEMSLYDKKLKTESVILETKLKKLQSIGSSGFFSDNAKKHVTYIQQEIEGIPGKKWKNNILSILKATMEILEDPRTATDEDAKFRWACGILGLDPENISFEQLHQQYWEKARSFHPDANHDEHASEWFKNLDYAKEFITRKLNF